MGPRRVIVRIVALILSTATSFAAVSVAEPAEGAGTHTVTAAAPTSADLHHVLRNEWPYAAEWPYGATSDSGATQLA